MRLVILAIVAGLFFSFLLGWLMQGRLRD